MFKLAHIDQTASSGRPQSTRTLGANATVQLIVLTDPRPRFFSLKNGKVRQVQRILGLN